MKLVSYCFLSPYKCNSFYFSISSYVTAISLKVFTSRLITLLTSSVGGCTMKNQHDSPKRTVDGWSARFVQWNAFFVQRNAPMFVQFLHRFSSNRPCSTYLKVPTWFICFPPLNFLLCLKVLFSWGILWNRTWFSVLYIKDNLLKCFITLIVEWISF